MGEGLPGREKLENLAREEAAETGTGPIEERKAALNRMLLGSSRPGASAIADVTADPSLREEMENLAVSLVAAIGRQRSYKNKAYNLGRSRGSTRPKRSLRGKERSPR